MLLRVSVCVFMWISNISRTACSSFRKCHTVTKIFLEIFLHSQTSSTSIVISVASALIRIAMHGIPIGT